MVKFTIFILLVLILSDLFDVNNKSINKTHTKILFINSGLATHRRMKFLDYSSCILENFQM